MKDEIDWYSPRPCCACGQTSSTVRTLGYLPKRAPIPGSGWGCVVCNLPCDGAIVVVCDACADLGMEKAPLRFAVKGWMKANERVPIGELMEPFEHNDFMHRSFERRHQNGGH